MTQIDVLQMCPFSSFLNQELSNRYRVHALYNVPGPDQARFLVQHCHAVGAVVTGGHLGIPNDIMAQLPALGLIAVNGVGLDKVDLDESRRRGIRVSITAGVLTDDVADLAVGMVISLLRGIPGADRFVRAGQWTQGDYPLTRKVSGRRFGIIGLGHIGRAIAARLMAFGPVAYCSTAPKDVPYPFIPSALELARQSDVLILAASANPSTSGMVNHELLDALGPQGYLVNVARGALVDEAALVKALQENRIAGAALDVFADEPRVSEALRTASNVLLTPHVASATAETRQAMANAVLASLEVFFSGKNPAGGVG